MGRAVSKLELEAGQRGELLRIVGAPNSTVREVRRAHIILLRAEGKGQGDMKQRLATGFLLTVDNQIDPATGTVRLKANFPNEKNELFPNQFVNARLLVDVLRGITVIPAPAVQRGAQGTFVYVVTADRTATVRPISIGEIQGGEASVKTGLSPGELVVVDGADRLREGTRLELRAQGPGTAKRAY